MKNNEAVKQSIKRQREAVDKQQVSTRRIKKILTVEHSEVAGVAYLKHNIRESYHNICINGSFEISPPTMPTYATSAGESESLPSTPATYATYATHAAPVSAAPEPSAHDLEVQAEREAIRAADGIHPTIDDMPPAVILEGPRRRSVVSAYRRHAPKSSVAMVSPEGADSWVLMEYADGTHVVFNTDFVIPPC